MPYVALPPSDRASTLAEAGPRWEAIATRQPELEPVVSLQRKLIAIIDEVAGTIDRARLPRLSLPPGYLAAKLARGVPATAREPIPIPVTALEPGLLRLCLELGTGGWGAAADRLHAVLTDRQLDAASILAMSLSRDHLAVRAVAAHLELSPDLLWLLSELAVSPYAHALQRSVLAQSSEPRLSAELGAWRHGYCPLCGSWPALGEVVARRRVLRCSFCALAWDLPAPACVYCGESGEQFVRVPAGELWPDRQLELCDACGSYFKTLDVTALSRFPLVAISDLDTMDLDMRAMERGYNRPRLKEFTLQITP
jgi:FdhE protein